MWHLSLRSILAHRVRLLTTALAVVLGVAFVSGTLVLTDTMRGTFDTLIGSVYDGVDVAVRGPAEFSSAMGGSTPRAPVPAELADRVAGLDGVAAVEGDLQGMAQLVGPDGQVLGTPPAPSLGGAAPVVEELSPARLRDGAWPTRPGEIAIDVVTARTNGLVVGDEVDVVAGGPATTQTIVGLVGWGEADNLAGATLALFDPATAFDLFNLDGGYASLNVQAADGVDRAALRDDVAAALGADWEVLTGDEMATTASAEVGEQIGFFGTALLVFAGIALVVGAFIIFNTFAILVAQRTREVALLRAVGASRRQVVLAVLAEAVATGLVGSLVGIVLGIGVATGLRALLDSVGLTVPDGDLVLAGRTWLAGLLVGTGVTAMAGLGPALRALRVPPVAAMQAVAAPPPPRRGRARLVVGGLVTALGVVTLALGLFAGAGIPAVAGGAVLVMIGFALLAALVTRPVLGALGWPLRRGAGMAGDLATQNALRNPRRTASTASALMIGLGLVSFVMIFGASLTSSTATAIEDTFRAELTVRGVGAMGPSGFSPTVVDDVRTVDGVATAMPMRYVDFRHDGAMTFGAGFDPETVDEVVAMGTVSGSLADVGPGELVVKEGIAEAEGWQVGDVVELEFAATGEQPMTLAAIVDADIDVSWFFTNDTIAANVRGDEVGQLFVRYADGADPDTTRAAIDAVLAGHPTVEALDQAELQASIEAQVDQLLGLLTGLLVLSVVIALFGLVNTLGLSVYERIRELGLLRAVGASRRQVRAMVRWEAVLIAVLGATLGLGIGTMFGWMAVRALADEGITVFSMPAAQLVGAFVVAAVAGVVAAVLPARRAARVDVLAALQMA